MAKLKNSSFTNKKLGKNVGKKSGMNWKLWLLVPLLLIVVVAGLELTNVIHVFHHRTASGDSIPSTSPVNSNGTDPKGSETSSPPSTSPTNSTSSTGTGTTTAPTPSGPAPLTPTGDFVSNHHPGGSAPTSEASTCNTTAGASCYIQFTQGSTTKKLNAQVTGGDGGTIWYWDVKNAGLSAGSWKVTAVATLNGQTKTADDALTLEVQ